MERCDDQTNKRNIQRDKYSHKVVFTIAVKLTTQHDLKCKMYFVGNKAKGRISKRTCTCAFVFLKHPFWDSPFCLTTDKLSLAQVNKGIINLFRVHKRILILIELETENATLSDFTVRSPWTFPSYCLFLQCFLYIENTFNIYQEVSPFLIRLRTFLSFNVVIASEVCFPQRLKKGYKFNFCQKL